MLRRTLGRLRLRTKLGFVAGTATALVIALTAYLTGRAFQRTLLDMVAESSALEGEQLRAALEAQMVSGDAAALERLVREMGSTPGIASIAVLDDAGRVRVSSEPGAVGRVVPFDSPEMSRLLAPPDRAGSESIVSRDRGVVRTLTAIPNRPACHACHGSERALNGMLVVDRSPAPLQRAAATSTIHVAIAGSAALAALLVSLGFAVRHIVLLRVARLRAATRRLGEGDLSARADDGTGDELGDLARDFDAMAARLQRDFSERKALEAGLEQSERLAALGVLASSVAHEVGNPLASIITAVDGLLARLDEPQGAAVPEMREYLEIVRKQVFRCRTVTERLLGFARIPSSEPVRVDAAAAAREVLQLVAAEARRQRVELRPRLADEAPALAADLLLEQVFLNLTLNALRAMPQGGVLTVEARVEADAVRVTFADTGPGIPEAIRRHLFEPFRTSRASAAGTGLGLFISQALVTRCGGMIEVESTPGAGAAFTVRLRRAPELPSAARALA
jgi:two-component system NtrC family sensor kinase